MGWRYRRSLRVSPGVRLNISKRGLSSISFGRPGRTLNVGRGGVRQTIGIPGSGLSYSTSSRNGPLLLLGLVLAGGVALVLQAGRGSRAAQATLALIVVAIFCLYVASPSKPHPSSTQVATSPAQNVDFQASAQQTSALEDPAVAVPSLARIPEIVPTPKPSPLVDLPASGATVPAPVTHQATVTSFANVRAGPGKTSEVLGQVHAGDVLLVLELQASWVKVGRNGVALGWVHRNLLSMR